MASASRPGPSPGKPFEDEITQVGRPAGQQVVLPPVWQAVDRTLLLQQLHHGQRIQETAHAAGVVSRGGGDLVRRPVTSCDLRPHLQLHGRPQDRQLEQRVRDVPEEHVDEHVRGRGSSEPAGRVLIVSLCTVACTMKRSGQRRGREADLADGWVAHDSSFVGSAWAALCSASRSPPRQATPDLNTTRTVRFSRKTAMSEGSRSSTMASKT